MSAPDPPPRKKGGCSGGCCRPAAAPAQEQLTDEANNTRTTTINNEGSTETEDKYSSRGCVGLKEGEIELKSVATKAEAQSCTSCCCGGSGTGPAVEPGDAGTMEPGLGVSRSDEQCGSGCSPGSSSGNNQAADKGCGGDRCGSFSFTELGPIKAAPEKDVCGDGCCGGLAKPALAPVMISKADPCSGVCCSDPPKPQVTVIPVDNCNDDYCDPSADDCNDGCCGSPKPAETKKTKGEIES
jgi:hypothetical protein